jgi:hypothetical protein
VAGWAKITVLFEFGRGLDVSCKVDTFQVGSGFVLFEVGGGNREEN